MIFQLTFSLHVGTSEKKPVTREALQFFKTVHLNCSLWFSPNSYLTNQKYLTNT